MAEVLYICGPGDLCGIIEPYYVFENQYRRCHKISHDGPRTKPASGASEYKVTYSS